MEQPGERGAVVSTLASLASLVAALSCCLPLGALLMAAGSATASVLFDKLRPALLALSVGCLIFAFVQTYIRRRCEFRHRRLRTMLLWFSAVVVIAMLAAPQYFATLIAGRLPALAGVSELRAFDAQEFLRRFDDESAQTRMVVLLSPS